MCKQNSADETDTRKSGDVIQNKNVLDLTMVKPSVVL